MVNPHNYLDDDVLTSPMLERHSPFQYDQDSDESDPELNSEDENQEDGKARRGRVMVYLPYCLAKSHPLTLKRGLDPMTTPLGRGSHQHLRGQAQLRVSQSKTV